MATAAEVTRNFAEFCDHARTEELDGRHVLTDCKVVVGQHVAYAHRQVLCARSEFFMKAFSTGMREARDGVVALQHVNRPVSKPALHALLRFLYCGDLCEVNPDTCWDVLALLGSSSNGASLSARHRPPGGPVKRVEEAPPGVAVQVVESKETVERAVNELLLGNSWPGWRKAEWHEAAGRVVHVKRGWVDVGALEFWELEGAIPLRCVTWPRRKLEKTDSWALDQMEEDLELQELEQGEEEAAEAPELGRELSRSKDGYLGLEDDWVIRAECEKMAMSTAFNQGGVISTLLRAHSEGSCAAGVQSLLMEQIVSRMDYFVKHQGFSQLKTHPDLLHDLLCLAASVCVLAEGWQPTVALPPVTTS